MNPNIQFSFLGQYWYRFEDILDDFITDELFVIDLTEENAFKSTAYLRYLYWI